MLRFRRGAAAATAALVTSIVLVGCSPESPKGSAPQSTSAAPGSPSGTMASAPTGAAADPSAPSPSHGSSGAAMLKNADGTTFTVADIPGKAKVVNFWATWCAPCIGEMPILNEMAKRYASKDVTFVAVSVDENGPADVKPFLDRGRVKIDFRLAYATFDDLVPLDVAPPIPDTLVFDAQGRLVKHFDKIIERPELEAAIAEALANGSK